ncbi:NAD(P)H-hydrate dehydratase [Lentilactobacillus buchneri]|uniref:ADP-dependent (S)-NAD(P)H-hydrate dehydratase n=1 Tax=Lentilactobacillus buchneri subsp. silagei CD034 TaxID=1071400 RepID=J9W652_LENBU|nr:NAD(P)H-hydrate dehydratase [Lentilactobacillus buchneri]MCC6100112.1 NAD(P)H-hydrate dehydratase [Lactobacillus sp.]AFS00425.1 carbohydrate kinase [Lentilactobacillus buchneri subsp. silagei CD034]MCT2900194.1 NAD(P)H-hydrate dehydratase [Lentilactobacillus buchneri]MCT3542108.1 NAD(P)H-hydrate dehydratase [Lentilactobacillus buchneri]MCT3544567.1 NAD(P)H-hydrate dehydratase [Lentilactobacillus buchneri]
MMINVKKITSQILTDVIRKRPADSFKGTYGKIALIGGSQNFGGAIIMASLAAVYSGAGLVTTITDPSNQTSLHDWLPEAMFVDWNNFDQAEPIIKSADVVVIGPGLGTDPSALTLLTKVFRIAGSEQKLVIDGSALTLLAANNLPLPKDSTNILTPHQMEWQRVSGIKIADQTPEKNQAAAKQLHAIVVVKSHRTQVYADNHVYENTGGTPAQATGGMGDTLAGMVGGFAAQFKNPQKAVLAAVYSHSAIADKLAEKQYVVLPHQISEALPKFMYKHQAK